ncbi:hypothetical protein DFO66_104100 [Brevibacterium sanguinis]|uniref:Uncharacterized protein n=2 Tax=Brevibacterium TaxID=1696 RepID=A0A366IJ50_9MICO|nr:MULTISPECIES: hypothetical protein [Brevibacterium]RBP65516.1 hypothetical protein DFO66_104100 [Brevibacterium sanguinis]RBP72150.1 hypothetical protein DFO65_104106 [Brevibacterium celere]
MSAKRVDTTIIVVAVAASVLGAAGLIGVLGQAWMGRTPSHVLTYLPMVLLPISFALAAVAMIRAILRRRGAVAGGSESLGTGSLETGVSRT